MNYVRKRNRRTVADIHTEFEEAEDYIAHYKIKAVKYNYSLEDRVQNFQTYNAEISLSKDRKEL